MTGVNIHVATAIKAYEETGSSFHDILSWHLLHGVVMITPEFLCLGYYCQKSEIGKPLPLGEADTGFVSYMTGDMAGLKFVTSENLSNIAFERGFRHAKPAKVYPIARFLNLIN